MCEMREVYEFGSDEPKYVAIPSARRRVRIVIEIGDHMTMRRHNEVMELCRNLEHDITEIVEREVDDTVERYYVTDEPVFSVSNSPRLVEMIRQAAMITYSEKL